MSGQSCADDSARSVQCGQADSESHVQNTVGKITRAEYGRQGLKLLRLWFADKLHVSLYACVLIRHRSTCCSYHGSRKRPLAHQGAKTKLYSH